MVGMGVLGGVGECKGMKGSLDLCGCNSARCVITPWGRKTSCVPHFAHCSCYCSELWRFTFLHLSCLSEWTAMVSQSGFGGLPRTECLLRHWRAWHGVFHFALTRRQPSPILRAGASLPHTYTLTYTDNYHQYTKHPSQGTTPTPFPRSREVANSRWGLWSSSMQPYSLWTHVTSWKHKTKTSSLWDPGRVSFAAISSYRIWWVSLPNSSSPKDDSKLTMYTGDILFQEVTPANADAFNGNAVEYLGGERTTTTRDLWEFLSTWLCMWISSWWIRSKFTQWPTRPETNYER